MTLEPRPAQEIDVDSLVRVLLERESERVDPRPLFERIRASSITRRSRTRIVWRWAGVSTLAAASIVIAATLFWHDRAALARGETVVLEARKAHAQPIDRSYLVEVRRESSLVAELSPSPPVRSTRLWTRGDRFWVESVRPEQRWAWGRDDANRFWIAFGPHTAVRLDADEVPPWLGIYCDLHSMNVEQLLGDVLGHFDLTRETGESGSMPIRVTARAKLVPGQVPSIETIEMEIDAETRVIRRMVVRRVWKGQPFATVTFSLAETDALDPADYQIEGHLSDPSEIFTRDHEPQRRRELLARWFGARPGRRLAPIETKP